MRQGHAWWRFLVLYDACVPFTWWFVQVKPTLPVPVEMKTPAFLSRTTRISQLKVRIRRKSFPNQVSGGRAKLSVQHIILFLKPFGGRLLSAPRLRAYLQQSDSRVRPRARSCTRAGTSDHFVLARTWCGTPWPRLFQQHRSRYCGASLWFIKNR